MVFKRRLLGIGICLMVLFTASFSMVACSSVSSYNVNLKYEPTKTNPKPDVSLNKVVFTIGEFNDLRKIDNKYIVGKVIDSGSKEIPVLTIQKQPSLAVANAIKDAFFRSGLTVAGDVPKWDLQGKNIKKEWGRIIIGGNIQQLEVVIKEGLTTKAYDARVNLRVMVGDVKKSQIFYIPTYESTNTLTDITVSDEKAQKIVNGVISTVIDRLMSDNDLWSKVADIIKKDP